ncbi:MazG family protein [Gordonia sp. X0973]|uniref:MazG family protein n=1 Tax=Gordonia sp. X0973 TaxID=2742602 RepID=UPI0026576173|nr:MazG family protein [Gordonia sp. X0973]
MTVVLLDPQNQDLLPFAAAKLVNGPVQVTEDVAASVLWALPHASVAEGDDGDPVTVLISTDGDHPFVRARVDRGEVVLSTPVPTPPVPEAPERRTGETLLDAVDLMDHLRTTGPWESRQTHDSLRRFVLEEVYELLDAIDVGTHTDVRDELGDLLLQVLFHARIAADDTENPFDIDDVAQAFIDKVTRRTPGVLSGEHSDLQRQIEDWETAKAAERASGSVLDGIVTTAPALLLVQKILERLSDVGFPLSQVDPALVRITVAAGGDSTEDATRQRALDLIDLVHEAERGAARDGVALNTPELWLHYLGVMEPNVGAPVEEPATDSWEADDSGSVHTEGIEDAPAAYVQAEEFPPAPDAPTVPSVLQAQPPTPVPAPEPQPPTPQPPAPAPAPASAYYPPEPEYVEPGSGPLVIDFDPSADLDPPITQFPTVIQPDRIAQIVDSDDVRAAAAAAATAQAAAEEAERAAEAKAPYRIRESEEEVTTTVPRPTNADDLTGRRSAPPVERDPAGTVLFTTEEGRTRSTPRTEGPSL